MAHSGLVHPNLTCDVCEERSVLMHCGSCHIRLCGDCVGKHVSSQHSKHHDVAGFKYRKHDATLPVCHHHPCQRCDVHCSDCDEPVCSKCMATSEHKEHHLDEITKIYVARRLLLLQEISFLQNTVIPHYDKMESVLDAKMSKLSHDYSSVFNKIISEEEVLHETIQKFFHRKKGETFAMKERDFKVLQEQRNGISCSKSTVETLLSKYKHVCGSNNIDEILMCPFEKGQYRRIPPIADITPPTFSPVDVDEKFCEQFVKLSPSVQKLKSRGQRLESASSIKEEKELLAEVELIGSFQSVYEELRRVHCIGNDQAWLSGSAHGTLIRMDINGKSLETVHVTHGYAPKDMVVSTDGSLIYCDVGSLSVNAFKDGSSKIIVKLTKWMPTSLCVTTVVGHLLVGMISKDHKFGRVVRYVGSKARQKIQFDDKEQDLFKKPSSLAENANENICVIDSSAQSLVVLTKFGLFRFRYNGSQKTRTYSFQPSGLATDSIGQIIVGDRMNTCLDIIDRDGQFIRSIAGSLLNIPSAISIDDNENLWVSEFHTGHVKIIKYLEFSESNCCSQAD
ncbi:uncharacterized protein LOC125657082 [Ostrea edulis]|uniref:uncharacterized protein LOC125657082 n=1 Tax=Ostrea edulis TaxID=37623 RepID=UPI0024AFEAE1|nr:uncharacterized protein LOC125657082 [Ostrea edulis]XP_048743674.2 uncharacterized protein LOC125657082 [Ostrea edulis]